MSPRVAFIGFGEAGQAMADGLRQEEASLKEGVSQIAAWDILFPGPAGAKLVEAANKSGVRVATSAADAVQDAELVIAAVTAASSLEAAQSVAAHLQGRPISTSIRSRPAASRRPRNCWRTARAISMSRSSLRSIPCGTSRR